MDHLNYESIKLIATDIDGTLLNSKRQISDLTKQSLIEMQKKGKRIALCTGRAPFETKSFIQELQLDQYKGYIVYGNGAGIICCEDNKNISFDPLKQEEIHYIVTLAREYHLYIIAEYQNQYIVESNKWVQLKRKFARKHDALLRKYFPHVRVTNFLYMSRTAVDVNDILEYLTTSVNKFIIRGKPKNVDQFIKRLKETDLYNLYRLTKSSVEVNHFNVSKANALTELYKKLNLKDSQVVVFGDSMNDHEMLSNFPNSVAMGNADQQTKEIASYTTVTNDEDGIIHFLKSIERGIV